MILACVLLIYVGGVFLFYLALSSLSADDGLASPPHLPLLPLLALVALWPLALVGAVVLVAWEQMRDERDAPC